MITNLIGIALCNDNLNYKLLNNNKIIIIALL